MSAAQRYHVRAPRYVLSTEDHRLMRFAAMETRGVSVTTELRNLSESGLAFTLPANEPHPDEGDMLKIEFTVPGHKQIACFATVVRVEESSEWDPNLGFQGQKIIGLQFRNLPEPFRRALRTNLEGRATSEETTEGASELNALRAKHFRAFAISSVAMLASLYLLAIPMTSWLAPFKALLFK